MQILAEHKLKYLNRRMIEIEELKKSLLNNDYEVAVNIGHKLKGNGETFGYPSISRIGLDMEKAGNLKDKVKLVEVIEELSLEVDDNLKKINEHIL